MKPILTGTAILIAGKNTGKEIPFKVFHNTPVRALRVFASNVLIESPESIRVSPDAPRAPFQRIYDAAIEPRPWSKYMKLTAWILTMYSFATGDLSIGMEDASKVKAASFI